jgi:hypothetical protein
MAGDLPVEDNFFKRIKAMGVAFQTVTLFKEVVGEDSNHGSTNRPGAHLSARSIIKCIEIN